MPVQNKKAGTAFNKGRSFKKIILIVVVLLLIVFVGGQLLTKKLFPARLSSQQQQLVERLGYPTSYTITFGEATIEGQYKPVRLEIWNYDRHGRAFYFVDGKFTKDSDIAFIDRVDPFPIVPGKFDKEMSLDQIKGIIGGGPTASGKVSDKLMASTTIYDFSDQVKIGVKDNKVIYIQTFPLTVKK